MGIFDKIKAAKSRNEQVINQSPEIAVKAVESPQPELQIETVDLPFDFTTASFDQPYKNVVALHITNELKVAFRLINKSLDGTTINQILEEALKHNVVDELIPDEIIIPDDYVKRTIEIEQTNLNCLMDAQRQLMSIKGLPYIIYQLLLTYAKREAGEEPHFEIKESKIDTTGHLRKLTDIYIQLLKLLKATSGLTMNQILTEMGCRAMTFINLKNGKLGLKRLERELESLKIYTKGTLYYDYELEKIVIVRKNGETVSDLTSNLKRDTKVRATIDGEVVDTILKSYTDFMKMCPDTFTIKTNK